MTNCLKMEPYNYRIVEESGGFYIYVLCGSSAAMYEEKKELSKKEVNVLMSDSSKLDEFLRKIRRQ